MAEIEWGKLAVETGISLVSGLGGLIIGAWQWGRSSAKAEHAAKEERDAKIAALRKEMETAMASHIQKSDARNDLLVSQFRESFEGIRRQIDQNVLEAERRFLPKGDFDRFLDEYRENQRRTDDKLDRLLGAQH